MVTSEHMTLSQIEDFLKENTDLKNYNISEIISSIDTLINNSYEDGISSLNDDEY